PLIFLLPSNDANNHQKNDNELVSSRYFHELCILYILSTKDISQFESSINYLSTYYQNYQNLPPSANQNTFVALNLLYLLSYNKLAEFHTAIELINPHDLQENKYIDFVVDLERQITIGNYSKVIQSKEKVPLMSFHVFLDRIIETIRYETARSAEKGYESLRLTDCVKLFHLHNVDQVQDFADQQNKISDENEFTWVVQNDRLWFKGKDHKNVQKFNAENLIRTSLSYAYELEKIV
ncbi:hypothetical protein IMG5_003230, partial [Ichthyophthirius multifiliis]